MSSEWWREERLVSPASPGRLSRVIDELGIIPVVAVENADDAVEVAAALAAGGLPIIEITLRTQAAESAIAAVRGSLPDVMVGAGTVLNAGDVDKAVAAGAQFGVAPGYDAHACARANGAGLEFIPGVATPSEVSAALDAGYRMLKLFPAETLGGVAMVRALMGPFGHTGVAFGPTGGIDLSRASEYWRQAGVAGVGGSWLAPKAAIRNRDWQAIAEIAHDTVAARASAVRS